MYTVSKWSEDELRILFRNTAQKMGFNEAIIEKDFWVCLTLDFLFNQCKWKDSFAFKGGTSLSKCYGLIHRFSEDIDLILDWRVLGFEENEPWLSRSKTKQEQFNKEANKRAELFLQNQLLPNLQYGLSKMIGKPAKLYIDELDTQTINFEYPHFFGSNSILQTIRLEIGALAAWTPIKKTVVTSYAALNYPNIFENPHTHIRSTTAERTFWEKVTILHHEANRPSHLNMPTRYSRHYYDLYCFACSNYKNSALNNMELLHKVVEFKMKFYPRTWAEYECAKPGSVKLYPPQYRLDALEKDYHAMREMIFEDIPDFETLMLQVKELETKINTIHL